MIVYALITCVVFVVSLAIGICDTISFDGYAKETFGYCARKGEIAKECLWDFGAALVIGLFWPLFLVVFIVMGVMGWTILR